MVVYVFAPAPTTISHFVASCRVSAPKSATCASLLVSTEKMKDVLPTTLVTGASS